MGHPLIDERHVTPLQNLAGISALPADLPEIGYGIIHIGLSDLPAVFDMYVISGHDERTSGSADADLSCDPGYFWHGHAV